MPQRRIQMHAIAATAALVLICLVALSRSTPLRADNSRNDADDHKNPVVKNATQKVLMGELVFRFDTFGDEAFWGDIRSSFTRRSKAPNWAESVRE